LPRLYRVYSGQDLEAVVRAIRSPLPLDEAIEAVRPIVEDVRRRGDSAVIEYTRRFDGVELEARDVYVDRQGLEELARGADPRLSRALEGLAKRVENAEEPLRKVIRSRWGVSVGSNIYLEIFFTPVKRVACYVPGGLAPYVSTAIMCGVTARLAGVERLVALLPPRALTPGMAASFLVAGFDGVYRVGGPHGIAAVAYGTRSIERVDRLAGPGGLYVAAAKILVSWAVGVDMVAGPTELAVYVDKRGYEEEILYHLAAQAEHGDTTLLIVVTPAEEIAGEIARLSEEYAYRGGSKAFERVSRVLSIVVTDSSEEAARFLDTLSPEHVEVCSERAGFSDMLRSYGVLIDGCVSSAINDYYSGANHILPTISWARVRGGLSVLDFAALRRRVIYRGPRGALRDIAGEVMPIAVAEGFPLHLESIFRGAIVDREG